MPRTIFMGTRIRRMCSAGMATAGVHMPGSVSVAS